MVDSLLLDIGLFDLALVLQPRWRGRRRGHHFGPALEDVNTLGATLSQVDVCCATSGCLQSRASRLAACEDLACVFSALHQNEILLFSHEFHLDIYAF